MVTMQAVADRAGVSLATVSFVVNGTKRVSPDTRTKVERAINELGYRSNVIATALAGRQTRIIGLSIPGSESRLGTSALRIITNAAKAAAKNGYHLVLWPTDDESHLADYASMGLVDAVIVMEVSASDPRVPVLTERKMPFLLVGRSDHSPDAPYVDINFEAAVTAALNRLYKLGHRKTALLVGDKTKSLSGYGPINHTVAAYEKRARALNLEPVIIFAAQNPAAGAAAAHELLANHPEVTAVLALNEDALYGFYSGLRAAGKDIPADCSLIALATSLDPPTTANPGISSYVTPAKELGQRSINTIIESLNNPEMPPLRELISCTFHEASSTYGPPRGAQ